MCERIPQKWVRGLLVAAVMLIALAGAALLPWRAAAQGGPNLLLPAVRFSPTKAFSRVQIAGACDLQNYVVAKTNGAQHTIKWPKNVGTCQMSVFALDAQGQIVPDSAQPLAPGSGIESYTAPAGANTVCFSCSVGRETCILEVDR